LAEALPFQQQIVQAFETQCVQLRPERTWSSVLMFIEQNFGPHCVAAA